MLSRIEDVIERARNLGIIRPRAPMPFRPTCKDADRRRVEAAGKVYGAEAEQATEFAIRLRCRPDFVCAYCHKPVARAHRQVDHVIPLARGGEHRVSNLAPCCRWCNASKGCGSARRVQKSKRHDPDFDFEAWCLENS